MPFTVRVDRAKQLVESRWDGVATADMLMAYVDEAWGDPSVRSFDELIDFRSVTEVRVPTDDVHAVAAYSRQLDNPDEPARSAVVAARGLVYGLSRMFSTLRSLDPSDNREFQVFEDIDAARAWLRPDAG